MKKAYALILISILSIIQTAGVSAANISACGNIISPGTYNLTQSIGSGGDCIVIQADDVIINGGGFTVTGNINANGPDNTPGYNITINNINVVGSVTANGGDDSQGTTPGNGGTIIISTSTISSVYSQGGSSYEYGAGNGGTITISSSTIPYVYSNGGEDTSGINVSGNGGTITINSSGTLNISNLAVNMSGGGDYGSGAGTDGVLNLNYVTLVTGPSTYFSPLSDLYLNTVSQGSWEGGTYNPLFPGNISSCGTITTSGTYTLTGNVTNGGNCFIIQANGVTINGTGYTVTGSIDGSGGSEEDGHTFTLSNITVTGSVYSQGGSDDNVDGAQSGGSVTIASSTILSNIYADGGADSGYGGGNGGSVTVSSSTFAGVYARGADDGTGAYAAGSGGSITITNLGTLNLSGKYINASAGGDNGGGAGGDGVLYLNYGTLVTSQSTVFYALSSLLLNGVNQGGFAGGIYNPLFPGNISSCGTISTSGTYTLTSNISGGDCIVIRASGVTINGGGFTVTGNINGSGGDEEDGYSFTLSNIRVTGIVYANSGFDTDIDGGQSGGSVTVSSSTISEIQAWGSQDDGAGSGAGGSVTISSSTVTNITTLGGQVTVSSSTVTSINSSGRGEGTGGTVTISGSSNIGAIYADGGSGNGYAEGGNGGVVTVSGSSSVNTIYAKGGSGDSDYAGGSGGTVTLNSSSTLNISNTQIYVSGGEDGGAGGGSNGNLNLNYGTLVKNNSTIFSAINILRLNGVSQGSFAGGVYGNILSPGNISACGILNSTGTYTLTASVSETTCFIIRANNVVINGAGHTVTGAINGNGSEEQAGRNFTLSNMNILGSVSSDGGADVDIDGGHNGGNITISSSTLPWGYTIDANGSEDQSGAEFSGNGGTITLTNVGVLDISNLQINADGADGGGSSGSDGYLYLNFGTLVTDEGTQFSSLEELFLNNVSQGPFEAGVYNDYPETVPPVISNINVTTGVSTATITWDTDENASSTVEYGLTTSYGAASSTEVYNTSHTIVLSGLTPDTAYNFRINSSDELGNLATSSNQTFTTSLLQVLPTLTVQSATSISTSSATLNASITNDGNASSTVRGFNYGLTTAYGSTTSVSGSIGVSSFSDTVTDLTCNTTYNYRAYATNSAGTGTSSNTTFTTSACPVVSTPSSGGGSSGGWSSPASGGGGGGSSSSVSPTTPAVVPTPNTPVLPTGKNIPKDIFTTPTGKPFVFNLNLKQAARSSSDIKKLQILLNSLGFTISQKGAGSPGKETINFGPATRSALIRFQIANKITPASGFFGPLTRGAVNKLIGEGIK
jgi:hypothetical protein